MRKIIIRNNGLVTPEDIFYIGNSSKRDDETKIGRFGSGWKYAIAWLMRNDCTPTIYSGLDEIKLTTRSIVSARSMFDAILINDKETSLTTKMGPDWKGWMALRELYSNAIDEGGQEMSVDYNIPKPVEGKTTVIVPANGELMEVLDKFSKYFCYERTAAYGNEHGRVFIKQENSSMCVFRKGINCWNDTHWKTMLDFDFNKININESRLTSIGDVDSQARKLLKDCDDPRVIRAALQSEYHDILPREMTPAFNEVIQDMVTGGSVFQMSNTVMPKEGAINIPKDWFIKLIEKGIIENPIQELFRTLQHEFHPLPGHELVEAEITHYLQPFIKNAIVKVGHISAGYNTVEYYAEKDKFIISEKYLNNHKNIDLKNLAAELLIAQRDILKEYVLSKM